ncbi:alpha/beta fold hydrolase [Furfurilactobacillus siliginis]|uniref:Alpha/beta hydrolase n=2 Tax=Furfurilactobacillus siliginis TaxID=348151 RepID=A0A510VPQ7_9LACO|nr:alpha/beta hydrolase [Furfurilactobacillus siliginis]GEK28917.1 alpha/beta hydrolase [Furfurilactobacillus siliginis]
MSVTTFTFPSSDRLHTVEARLWRPESTQPVKGTIQLVHGMAEHIDRYADFAQWLTANGWVVAGDNHLGHGHTGGKTPLGYFGTRAPVDHLIDDEFILTKYLRQNYPGLPHVIIGHSMGSMMTQVFLTRYGHWIDAAVLIGTSAYHPILTLVRPIVSILNSVAPKRPNHFLDNLAFGGYAKRFPEDFPFQWLSANADNVHRYNADPLSGFTFTNNGFKVLFQLTHLATRRHWFDGIPLELPMLITSGEHDPVGGFGQGPKRLLRHLTHAGYTDVTLKTWPQMRHEILNERDHEQVYALILNWIETHLSDAERK